ncbi:FUSC family protein [Daejeonella oryzae]|uniref:FUSC family protein n=1 Tax=Daejeonella oryzae TaxID=1122943 RepID=UPI00047ED674|nr:FUSC family membrane protein [Daejeonella oryzae]
MIQTREVKTFVFSQYFSDGLRISLGVLLPSLIFNYLGYLAIGVTVSLGALCVSLADNPGPYLHKRNGMLICNLFLFFTALLTGLVNNHPVLVGLEIVLLCFFFSMFSIYGARASAIGTASLLVMILSIDPQTNNSNFWEHTLYILLGGIWYTILSLSVSQIRPYRLAQQALGECIAEVANYIRLKSKFYDVNGDFDENYGNLIKQQVLVHQQQDTLRELLFNNRMMTKESTPAGRLLILIFVDIVDLFEQSMATLYDYQAIRNTYGKTEVLEKFKITIQKIANELDNLSYHVLRNDHPVNTQNFQTELENLKAAVDRVESEFGLNNMVLKKILVNARNMVTRTQKIFTYFNVSELEKEKIRSESDLAKFVSHQDFDFKQIGSNLNLNSSIFRHSIRVAVVCLIGYLVSKILPIGFHSYWILLTILVILKPGFSLTKQRNYERLIGTLAGGIIGSVILILIKDEKILFVFLLFFMVASYSFQRLNYVVSVIFMTPYILILFSFLGENNLNIARERIIDTFIGSFIALLANNFVLPSWEYQQLKKYVQEVLIANYNYLLKVADNMAGKPFDITSYKLARKSVYLSSANIGSAFQRMLSEPKKKQKNNKELHKFIVLNHILSSYTATLISSLDHLNSQNVQPEHVKMIRKSLFTISEMINDANLDPIPDFKSTEELILNIPPATDPENRILTEQLEFVNKLCTDIQKIHEKLNL